MTSIRIVVPLLPPSVNHYWEGQGKNTRVSAAGRAYKAAVAIFAGGDSIVPACRPLALKQVCYRVSATVVFGKGKKGDVDNCGKAVCDGLKDAGVIHSDDRVMEFHVYKDLIERPAESRTEIIAEVIA